VSKKSSRFRLPNSELSDSFVSGKIVAVLPKLLLSDSELCLVPSSVRLATPPLSSSKSVVWMG
jgi:hypothetical protein